MPSSRGSFFRDQTCISCSSWIAGRFFTAEPTGKPTGYITLKSENHSVVSDSLQPHGLCSPWNSPGQNTGVGNLSFSRGSSQCRDWTQVSLIAGRFFACWTAREALVLYGDLNGKEIQTWEDSCMFTTDSLFCTAELCTDRDASPGSYIPPF